MKIKRKTVPRRNRAGALLYHGRLLLKAARYRDRTKYSRKRKHRGEEST